jgi:hypothetical protein
MKGVASLERGKRQQAVFETRCCEQDQPLLAGSIKRHLNLQARLDNSKCTVKIFEQSQVWGAMIGYVQKTLARTTTRWCIMK